jgi:hypothetical protein
VSEFDRRSLPSPHPLPCLGRDSEADPCHGHCRGAKTHRTLNYGNSKVLGSEAR